MHRKRMWYCAISFVMFLLIGGPSLPAQSLLWKIEGKDLPAPSYLFGTIHAICPADAVLGDAVLSAVDSTAQIALELDLDDERLLVEVGRLSFLPGDSTLKDLYTEEDFARLDRWIQDSVGVSIQPMLAFRPLWLVGLLMNKILGCKATSYEQLFMAIARKQGKEVIGIESPEEQMQAFSSIPLREQAAMVLEMVDHADSTRAEFQRLAEAYTRQDLDLLRTLVENSTVEYGRYQSELLTMRNRNWIPRILRAARTMPTFFAVGAGHLPGQDGLIMLLREKGYRVTAVR